MSHRRRLLVRRPGDALDSEAEKRGNSVYFPDRVVPMLPEALSNELCSLKPELPRACLRPYVARRWRAQNAPPLRARADALGGAGCLRADPGGARRRA